MVTILGSMVNIPHSYLTQFMQLFVLQFACVFFEAIMYTFWNTECEIK